MDDKVVHQSTFGIIFSGTMSFLRKLLINLINIECLLVILSARLFHMSFLPVIIPKQTIFIDDF